MSCALRSNPQMAAVDKNSNFQNKNPHGFPQGFDTLPAYGRSGYAGTLRGDPRGIVNEIS